MGAVVTKDVAAKVFKRNSHEEASYRIAGLGDFGLLHLRCFTDPIRGDHTCVLPTPARAAEIAARFKVRRSARLRVLCASRRRDVVSVVSWARTTGCRRSGVGSGEACAGRKAVGGHGRRSRPWRKRDAASGKFMVAHICRFMHSTIGPRNWLRRGLGCLSIIQTTATTTTHIVPGRKKTHAQTRYTILTWPCG